MTTVEKASNGGNFFRNFKNIAALPIFRGIRKEEEMPSSEIGTNVTAIRKVTEKDYEYILRWLSDPETRRHLDPLPSLPENWNDKEQVRRAVDELAKYYNNFGERKRITPIIAADSLNRPLGVETLRWHGDHFVPEGRRIASLERVIVDPKLHHKGIGNILTAAALHYAFDLYKGYNGKGANQIRVWIMTDAQAGDYHINYNLFRKFGFQIVQGEGTHWREYAKKEGIKTDRDALWLKLERGKWESLKETPDVSKVLNKVQNSIIL